MKRILLSILVVLSLFMFTGCTNNQSSSDKANNDNGVNESKSESEVEQMKIIIDGKSYEVKLEYNETVQEFIKILPREFEMSELNGNEKYVYMEESFPSNSKDVKHIKAGDIMLYGSDCLVIFYKSFDTSYSYTKIGHVDSLPDLGKGKVTIRFE